MQKKRILMCAEYHGINSGFGRYTKEILSRLYERKDFEIAEFASYRKEDAENNDVPWKVYPNQPDDNAKDKDFYSSNPINQFGQWRFEKTVLDFKPDIVFDIRDYWMFSYQETSPLRQYYHWVVAPTIDSIPQRPEWLKTYENADVVLTHTDWAANYLRSLNRPINVMGCVSDSVDSSVFKPINYTKAYHKSRYGLPSDSIVIGSVMRNQKRKLIPELFRSLRELLNDLGRDKKIYLYLHTSFPESQGWNIPELLQEFDVSNNVLFTYYSPQKDSIVVSPYKGPKIKYPGDENAFCIFPNVIHGVSDKHLNEIYNCFDIYVQYAICEGLGIPQLEAASCGIPIFSVNYSGMEEITSKVCGVKINNRLCKELETGAERAVPDNDHLISEIKKWIQLTKQEKTNLSTRTRKLLIEHYSWDKTASKIIEVFDSLPAKNLWNKPMECDPTAGVPTSIENNREFVYWIVNNIIKSPELIKTSLIQNIVRGMDENYSTGGGNMNNFDKKAAVQTLETYLNNKIFYEKVRSGEIKLTDSFLSR